MYWSSCLFATVVAAFLLSLQCESTSSSKLDLLELLLHQENEEEPNEQHLSSRAWSPGALRPVVGRLWTRYRDDDGNYVIPYRASARLKRNTPAMRSLMRILSEVSSRTCLKLVRRTVDLHKDYIHFVQGRRCMTRIGRKGGPQMVFIGGRCTSSSLLIGRTLMLTFGFGKKRRHDQTTDAGLEDYIELEESREDNLLHQKPIKGTRILPDRDIESIHAAYQCNSVTTLPPPTTSTPLVKQLSCGRPVIKPSVLVDHRILGGTQARFGSFPWQASINFKRSGKLICGGSLINPWWILTAAHCFLYSSDPGFYVGYLGKHYKHKSNEGERKVLFHLLMIHDGYNYTTKRHDIALAKVKTKVLYTNIIRSVCLPSSPSDLPNAGEKMVVTGWGETHGTGNNNVLRQLVVPLIDYSVCKSWYPILSRGMLCAGYSEGGMDACSGDSGGPLVSRVGVGIYRVTGIVSWGEGCGEENKPGVYTDVAYYLSWIYSIMSYH